MGLRFSTFVQTILQCIASGCLGLRRTSISTFHLKLVLLSVKPPRSTEPPESVGTAPWTERHLSTEQNQSAQRPLEETRERPCSSLSLHHHPLFRLPHVCSGRSWPPLTPAEMPRDSCLFVLFGGGMRSCDPPACLSLNPGNLAAVGLLKHGKKKKRKNKAKKSISLCLSLPLSSFSESF